MRYSIDKTIVEFLKFSEFIDSVSNDFHPSFLSYVDKVAYFNKILNLAEIITAWDDDKIVALCVTYCNDMTTKEGYTSFLAVKKEYRGHHIASLLMEKTFSIALSRGIGSLKIRTNNPQALRLYQKLGYVVYNQIYEEENHSIRYYLEKKL